MGEADWPGANMDVWLVTVLCHQFALPFACLYSRDNFLFKAFHDKRARKAYYESVLNCASQRCLSRGEYLLCVGKLGCLLATSLPPCYCLRWIIGG